VLLLVAWGCLIAAACLAGWSVCAALRGLVCHTPLWGVEAACEGLHAQDAEDEEGQDADGSVDAEGRGQRLAGDSCCMQAGQRQQQQRGARRRGGFNIGTASGCPWLLPRAAEGLAGCDRGTEYSQVGSRPANQSWPAGCRFMHSPMAHKSCSGCRRTRINWLVSAVPEIAAMSVTGVLFRAVLPDPNDCVSTVFQKPQRRTAAGSTGTRKQEEAHGAPHKPHRARTTTRGSGGHKNLACSRMQNSSLYPLQTLPIILSKPPDPLQTLHTLGAHSLSSAAAVHQFSLEQSSPLPSCSSVVLLIYHTQQSAS
jgi:hypothetical protein